MGMILKSFKFVILNSYLLINKDLFIHQVLVLLIQEILIAQR